jgi:hypothetical protein
MQMGLKITPNTSQQKQYRAKFEEVQQQVQTE